MTTKEYQAKYRREHRKQFREYGKKFYKKNKEKLRKKHAEHYAEKRDEYRNRLRKNHLERKYGITIEFFEKLLNIQQGKCKICETPFTEKTKACVDHCHKGNNVRGLLCRPCNLALSVVENKEFVEKAHQYLKTSDVEDKEPLR